MPILFEDCSELLISVIEFLSIGQCVHSCMLVCKCWHRHLSQNEHIWLHYLSVYFPLVDITPSLNSKSVNVDSIDNDSNNAGLCLLKRQIHYQKCWHNFERMNYKVFHHVQEDVIRIVKHMEKRSYEDPVFITCSFSAVMWLVNRGHKNSADMYNRIDLIQHSDDISKIRWSTNSSDWLERAPNHLIGCSSDQIVVTASWDGTVSAVRFGLDENNQFHVYWRKTIDSIHEDRVLCLSEFCSLDSRGNDILIASGGCDSLINIIKINHDQCAPVQVLKGHDDNVQKVLFLSSQTLASCSRDATIRIWNLQQGCIQIINYDCGVYKLEYCPQMQYLCAGTYNAQVHVYQIVNSKAILLKDLKGHTGRIVVMKLKYLKNRKEGDKLILATGSKDLSIKTWDLKAGTLLHNYDMHGGILTACDFDQEKLISGSYDQVIRIFHHYEREGDIRASTMKQLSRIDKGYKILTVDLFLYQHDTITSLSYTLSQLVAGCGDGSVIVWSFFSEE